ncbi:exodeoxyribonuclease VII small subunit [Ruminococcus sp. HUN007]|uniref:exodeoxyribonuclease VII small subunit n=1 Tax=Ruminococcus sp. HUN007 TaxID=1514668 RepID=UPI000AEF386A|nr:exodeoxyribonuclease VII small subunit [Ruminococcus sp. HUN007]
MSFEKKLEELEQIVAALESGKIPLDKAVELYGKGMKLSLDCRKELDEAKMKITVAGENDGTEV